MHHIIHYIILHLQKLINQLRKEIFDILILYCLYGDHDDDYEYENDYLNYYYDYGHKDDYDYVDPHDDPHLLIYYPYLGCYN